MRVRRPWLLLMVLLIPGVLFTPAAAHADDHRAELFAAGFSFVPGSLLLGPHVAFGMTLPKPGSKDFSVVTDFSTHFGPDEDTGKRVTFAAGGRWSATLRDHFELVHSARALLGGVYGTDLGVGDTDFAFLVGYEAEYIPNRTRAAYEGWAFRAQADYVVRKGDSENFFRFSTGVVYRWHKD